MDTILQGLQELAGVSASIVFDGAGRLVGCRGHAVYDRALCEQVSGALTKAIDSIQLEQEDWESITAQFADGKLILRNLGAATDSRSYVLAVVADATLNASFATVAIRVAANKLKKAIQGGAASDVSPAAPATSGSSVIVASAEPARSSAPVLAASGLSWSKTQAAGSSVVAVADPASSAFLTRCAKELARHVGPMSKVYVSEALRRVSPGVPFSVSLGKQLVDDLAGHIEDQKDREQFRKGLGNG